MLSARFFQPNQPYDWVLSPPVFSLSPSMEVTSCPQHEAADANDVEVNDGSKSFEDMRNYANILGRRLNASTNFRA